jgi:hypothetical protein
MSELLYEDEHRELWKVNSQVVQLSMPNWSTMGVYAQVWSVQGQRWELLWHLEEPAIVKALNEKTDMDDARNLDRAALLAVVQKVL